MAAAARLHRIQERASGWPPAPELTAPSTASPLNMRATATALPTAVTGYRSPYPTVVMVVIAHHRASPNVRILASGTDCSASSTANAATKTSRAADPAT